MAPTRVGVEREASGASVLAKEAIGRPRLPTSGPSAKPPDPATHALIPLAGPPRRMRGVARSLPPPQGPDELCPCGG